MSIILAWLLADFISGLAHWAEDKLLVNPSRWGFLEGIRLDNTLHHEKPAAMLKFTLWQNINTTAYWTLPIAAILFVFGAPIVIWLAMVFVTFGNIIHRFAHYPPHAKQMPLIVRWLQYSGAWLGYYHHFHHHFGNGLRLKKEESVQHYCVMSNWLNPVLDKIKFWKMLEAVCLR